MSLLPAVLTARDSGVIERLTTRFGGACRAVETTFYECSQPFRVLGTVENFALHVPRSPDGSAILLLHGAGRDHLTLVAQSEARGVLERSRAIIVMPRGRLSWWINTPGSAYEDFVLELMDRVEATTWSVAGWSMGGFGSLRLAVRHPDRFVAWAGLLALADFPNPTYPREQNHSVPAIFGPPAQWAGWNPLPGVEKLRGKRLWFTTGTAAFDRSMNETLDRRLMELGIPHEFHLVPGGHELRVVVENLQPMLRFLEKGDKHP